MQGTRGEPGTLNPNNPLMQQVLNRLSWLEYNRTSGGYDGCDGGYDGTDTTLTTDAGESKMIVGKCVVCMVGDVRFAYTACGHLCLCGECGVKGGMDVACPLCRTPGPCREMFW
jgi:hypothetical protein